MKIKELVENRLKIHSFWRQIAGVRTHTHDNIYTRGQMQGNMSYTSQGEARNEPPKEVIKDYFVAWIYWTGKESKEDVMAVRNRVGEGRYTGLTINGDELIVMNEEDVEKLKTWGESSGKLSFIGKYNLKLFN